MPRRNLFPLPEHEAPTEAPTLVEDDELSRVHKAFEKALPRPMPLYHLTSLVTDNWVGYHQGAGLVTIPAPVFAYRNSRFHRIRDFFGLTEIGFSELDDEDVLRFR